MTFHDVELNQYYHYVQNESCTLRHGGSHARHRTYRLTFGFQNSNITKLNGAELGVVRTHGVKRQTIGGQQVGRPAAI